MAILSNKAKKVLRFVSVGALLAIAAVGVAVKENKTNSNTGSGRNYGFSVVNNALSSKAQQEISQPEAICRDMLNEDENSLAFQEYAKTQEVDCLSVGCGGLF